MENNTFKGSIFGGFNRQDVMEYIEKSSRESSAMLEENAAQIQALEAEVQQLRRENEALLQERDALTAALHKTKESLAVANDALRAEQESAAQMRNLLELSQVESEQNATALAKAAEAAAALQSEVDEYHKHKKNIAEVELEAKHRADEVLAQAKMTGEGIRQKAKNDSAALLRDADERARKITEEATQSAAAIRQKAEQQAMLKRQQMNAMLSGCQKQYEALMGEYKSSALQAATSIQRAQEAMTQLPDVFEKFDTGLARLCESGLKKD